MDYGRASACAVSKRPTLSKVSILFAAKAAANNQQIDQAKQLLQQFVSDFPDDKDYADVLLAEILIQVSEIDQAQTISTEYQNRK